MKPHVRKVQLLKFFNKKEKTLRTVAHAILTYDAAFEAFDVANDATGP